jgi:acyl carrier protein
MDNLDQRLMRCFTAVFPTLSEDAIRSAVQDSTAEWDSLASLLLARTIEEEFGIETDLAMMDHLTTFDAARAYLSERTPA